MNTANNYKSDFSQKSSSNNKFSSYGNKWSKNDQRAAVAPIIDSSRSAAVTNNYWQKKSLSCGERKPFNNSSSSTVSSSNTTATTVTTTHLASKVVVISNQFTPTVTSSSTKIVFSRMDIIKLINKDDVELNIVLPKSISNDCLSINRVDLSYLATSSSSNDGGSSNENEAKTVLQWQFGSKLTKLVHHENGYVPRNLRQAQAPVCSREEFDRTMKQVFNKMTPENFDTCVTEIRKLNVGNSEENLISFVDQVFAKAIQEESYCKLYSQLARKFVKVTANGKNFKSLLLNKCQQMFKKPLDTIVEEVKQLWRDKIAAEPDERMKVMYEESVDEHVNKAKDKYFGNIRFISEMYIQGELTENIIVHVLRILLSKVTDTVCLELACKMLMLVGKILDSSNSKQVDEFINQCEQLSVSKELTMKIRFKFKDVLDMRKRDWQMRQIQMLKNIEPKTLDALKKEECATAATAVTKERGGHCRF